MENSYSLSNNPNGFANGGGIVVSSFFEIGRLDENAQAIMENNSHAKTTEQLIQLHEYTNWDFYNVWEIQNMMYPMLRGLPHLRIDVLDIPDAEEDKELAIVDGVNLALEATAFTDALFVIDASFALDGNLDTYCESVPVPSDMPMNFIVDLGAIYEIEHIRILWHSPERSATSFRIMTATDIDGYWTTVADVTEVTSVDFLVELEPMYARFIRLSAIGNSEHNGIAVRLFEVFGDPYSRVVQQPQEDEDEYLDEEEYEDEEGYEDDGEYNNEYESECGQPENSDDGTDVDYETDYDCTLDSETGVDYYDIDPPIEVCHANFNHPPKRGDCDTNIAERFNCCRNIINDHAHFDDCNFTTECVSNDSVLVDGTYAARWTGYCSTN